MRIGVIGSGMIGSTLAELWVRAGHDVMLSSRHPEALTPLTRKLGARATAGTPAEAVEFGSVVLLAVPMKAIPELATRLGQAFEKKVVIDAGNAYEARDGSAARAARDASARLRGLGGRTGPGKPMGQGVQHRERPGPCQRGTSAGRPRRHSSRQRRRGGIGVGRSAGARGRVRPCDRRRP
jgi:hypothetical protein